MRGKCIPANFRFEGDTQSWSGHLQGIFGEVSFPGWLALFIAAVGLLMALALRAVDSSREPAPPIGVSQAWRAGWGRGWTLLGIGILPAIPALLMLVLGRLSFLAYASDISTDLGVPAIRNVAGVLGLLACLIMPLTLLLGLLQTFANRACMLEGLGVLDAYRRGLQVLAGNLGSAVVLFVIQVGVLIGMLILLIVPGILLALCCLAWPRLMLFQGAVTAYFSTLWTLAWERWTRATPSVEKAPLV